MQFHIVIQKYLKRNLRFNISKKKKHLSLIINYEKTNKFLARLFSSKFGKRAD